MTTKCKTKDEVRQQHKRMTAKIMIKTQINTRKQIKRQGQSGRHSGSKTKRKPNFFAKPNTFFGSSEAVMMICVHIRAVVLH